MEVMDTHSKTKSFSSFENVSKFKANFVTVLGIILGSLFLVIGIYMMISDDSDNFLRVRGTVVESNCFIAAVTYDDKGYVENNTYKCDIVIGYKIDGDVYSNKMYIVGSNNYAR